MLSKYKCMIDGHAEQLIIGICENVNCALQRKVCLDCVDMHSKNDKEFVIVDIKNEKGIQIMVNEFKEKNIDKLNNIYL